MSAFITLREAALVTPDQAEEAASTLHSLEQFTEEFLQPFIVTSFMETGHLTDEHICI